MTIMLSMLTSYRAGHSFMRHKSLNYSKVSPRHPLINWMQSIHVGKGGSMEAFKSTTVVN